jgi:hypothetical protein
VFAVAVASTQMNNNDIASTHSDRAAVQDGGATSSQIVDGVANSNENLSQTQSTSDLTQVKSDSVLRPSDATSIENDPEFGYMSFKVGFVDPIMGVKIKEILLRNDSCVVYIDEKFTLQWYWSFALNTEAAAKIFTRVGDLEARIQFLREKKDQHENHENRENLLSALRLIGEGIVELFTTNGITYADAALETAEKFVTQRAREVSRRWYFIPFLIYFAISALVILVSYLYDPGMTKQIAIICTFAGGLGSFISRALDNDNTPISATAGRMLHWIEATLRWCIGLTAGLVVWLLVTGKVAASFLNTGETQNTFGLIAIALLAGASERLLPSLIQTFDDSIKTNKTQQTASGSGS